MLKKVTFDEGIHERKAQDEQECFLYCRSACNQECTVAPGNADNLYYAEVEMTIFFP